MTAAGAWVLMTWGDFVSCLVLAVLAAVLVGLLVGYRIGVRAQARHVPSDCRTHGATTRRPAREGFSPDLLQHTDSTNGGHDRG